MANIKLILKGSIESDFSRETELECFANKVDEITISINDGMYESIMSLDISTAIEFSKLLRASIKEIKEEANNG